MRSISAAEANRRFLSLLREASRGRHLTVTSKGKPIAAISPADQIDRRERESAKRSLLARLRATPASGVRGWTRDVLYK